ncbi:TPA: dipeptidyl aminopeptidase [Candidatus Poribacteria bacterium]|nr:dipeptidyl aminopeptidase [Candidatus Poribacteria bacterium]
MQDLRKIIWDLDKLSIPPEIYSAPEFESDADVKAIFYDGLRWNGKPTKVFAWLGIPKNKTDEPMPAMVLIHGGGGTAFQEWVRLWNNRGYSAIAMDLCGCIPKGVYGNWNRHESGGPPGWGGFDQIDWEIEDQWTYHAISDIILAHSIMSSLPEVDPNRIGMTGISWGGYLACIASGVDNRFKFAVPVYGCGFLGVNSCWLPTFQAMGEEKAEKWLNLWDPSNYLKNTMMPTLWVTGTNDFAYPLDSVQRSYRATKGEHTLCIKLRMPHGHGGAGENPEEIHAYANSYLKNGSPLAKIIDYGIDENIVWASFESISDINQAEILFTKDLGDWFNREWYSEPANIDKNIAFANLPENATVCYLNLIDKDGLVVSSEHIEI